MARKPNYQFDRSERERKKAAKKAAKLNAKKDARETTGAVEATLVGDSPESPPNSMAKSWES